MINLDDLTIYQKENLAEIYESLKHLPYQCEQAWKETAKITFPEIYQDIGKIVISGMGGSSYGARIVKSLYENTDLTKIPIELANNYWLPGYVDSRALVILSSYSGNTEETLATAALAQKRGSLISGITGGGKLADFLRKSHYPSYIFNPIHNPSKQPRIGFGYMVVGLLGILSRLKKVPISHQEIKDIVYFLNKKNREYNSSSPTGKNPAKKLALKFPGKIPLFIVADFLEGAAYAVRNMFHETAKEFSLHFAVPELNHHLLEGLTYPYEAKKHLLFVFVESGIYDKRNNQRLLLTKDIVKKNQIPIESVSLSAKSALEQTMEFLQLGAWTSLYLAIINRTDPAKIPWVDYFKERLKKTT